MNEEVEIDFFQGVVKKQKPMEYVETLVLSLIECGPQTDIVGGVEKEYAQDGTWNRQGPLEWKVSVMLGFDKQYVVNGMHEDVQRVVWEIIDLAIERKLVKYSSIQSKNGEIRRYLELSDTLKELLLERARTEVLTSGPQWVKEDEDKEKEDQK